VLLATAVACAPAPSNATPEGAVRSLVERFEQFDGSETDARALYDLLSERAKDNLRARAARYGDASGKTIEPWAMIVPARASPRFVPQLYRARIVGKYALVEVLGVASDQRAQLPCVLEDRLWRVDLVLPELPPVSRRPVLER
jgi:hypothetical protein